MEPSTSPATPFKPLGGGTIAHHASQVWGLVSMLTQQYPGSQERRLDCRGLDLT